MPVIGLTLPKGGLDLRLLRHTTIQPSQARVVPIEILESSPFRENILEFTIHATSTSGDVELPVSLQITHLPHWSTDASPTFYINSTYLYSGSTPTAFLVKPPLEFCSTPQVPVVALRRISSPLTDISPLTFWHPLDGAGVDIFNSPFWRDALPRQVHSWTIIPSGRTSWVCIMFILLSVPLTLRQGFDWHGPSSTEVWHCVEAFGKRLSDQRLPWAPWSIPPNARVVLIGHSNGGQGTWHMAGRFPDRVVAGK